MNPNSPKKKKIVPQLHAMEAAGFILALLSSIAAADMPNPPPIPMAPERILMRISPSVVAVDVMDAQGKSTGQGSGVVIGVDQVITACHVVKETAKEGKRVLVRKSGKTFQATLQHADPDRNICQLNVTHLEATPITLGSAKKIRAGHHVYAIGVTRGREPALGKGVVLNSRPHGGSQYMHISAATAPGYSGGGLVDDQGRLTGILSLQSVEHQDLTFALPVEWVGELAKRTQPLRTATNKDGLDTLNRSMALEQKPDWPALLKLSQQEAKHDPANAAAWYGMGIASAHLKQYNQAVHAYREAIRNQSEYAEAWHKLGVAYANLKEYDHAIHAYRDALRIQRDNADGWYDLGNTHYELKQFAHAVHSYREALRIQPENADAWYNLGVTYDELNLYGESFQAYQETVRIQPENAEAWYKLGVAYARVGERGKTREIYQVLRKLDPVRAERYFNTYILP